METWVEQNSSNALNYKHVFELLNNELLQISESLTITCAGGFVLQFFGYKATLDVDAFYKSNSKIKNAIRKVGDKLQINKSNELWLNNSIANLNSEPPVEYCKQIYKFSNLDVRVVDIAYLIGMKFMSARTQDLQDIVAILQHDNNTEPFKLRDKLINMGFSIDISLLLEAYGEAHGIEWLEEFYRNNESTLFECF